MDGKRAANRRAFANEAPGINVRDRAEVIRMARQWVAYDWWRVWGTAGQRRAPASYSIRTTLAVRSMPSLVHRTK